MLNQLAVMMGGRAAEELVFETGTTGAENDLKQATKLARQMVLEWGMSEEFMHIAWGNEQKDVFLGRSIAQQREYSEQTARENDEAVRNLLQKAYERTLNTLRQHRSNMDDLVAALLEREEIPGSELKELMKAKSA